MARAFVMLALLASAQARLHTPSVAPHLTVGKHRSLIQVQTAASNQQQPMFNKETMPKVSPTVQCVICLSVLYFLIYTFQAVVRTMSSFGGDGKFAGWLNILHKAATTVTYAPMLCVLFLGARMRAIQLTQGETEKFGLPQPWVQWAMCTCAAAVLFEVILVLIIPVFTREMDIKMDKQGNLDMKQMKIGGHAATFLSVARYVVMIALYGGFTTVIIGVFSMQGPTEIWGDSFPPVSPAVLSTIVLTTVFFGVQLVIAIVKTIEELKGELPQMLQAFGHNDQGDYLILDAAESTADFAPMLSILFIGARMRALQMDPKHGNPQFWAQMCFYACAGSVAVQALMALIMPLCVSCEVTKGDKGDLVHIKVGNTTAAKVVTAIRYVALVALYLGFTAVIVSVFLITHPTDITLTPPISPAMQCVMNLTIQYFTIYLGLMICNTVKQFMTDGHPVIVDRIYNICEAASGTVMFAPMLSMLFIGARMRALQLTKSTDGTIPPTAGPQRWVQEAMFLSTWSVLVQLVMVIIAGCLVGEGKPEMDDDGNVKIPLPAEGSWKYAGYAVEALRYLILIAMYGGVVTVIAGIFMMEPEDLPPYRDDHMLPAGIAVPSPPTPPTKADVAF